MTTINFNAKNNNKSEKLYKVKVCFDNGFSLDEIQASSFGQACYRLEKYYSKKFVKIISFSLVSHD